MLIGQITDVHIGFDAGNPREGNMLRLETVLERLLGMAEQPDILLLTGDLTEHGDAASFVRLADALRGFPAPVWPIPGNHDLRDELLAAFPHVQPSLHETGGFIQYAIEQEGLRLVMLDTLDVGRHGGAFCETRARWLQAELAAHPGIPTALVMHHPPFPTGIAWMDTQSNEPWVARFAEAIAGQDQIVAILCGHVHRAAATAWHGRTAIICPSSAPAVALNLTGIDPDQPDGRALITDEPPGFALHRWDGVSLVSHLLGAVDAATLAAYDARLQPMIRGMFAERP